MADEPRLPRRALQVIHNGERQPREGHAGIVPRAVDEYWQFRAKLPEPLTGARLEASHRPDMDSSILSDAVYTLPLRKDDVYRFPLRRLKPDTRYHFRLLLGGQADTASSGGFRTFPAGPSFGGLTSRIASASVLILE